MNDKIRNQLENLRQNNVSGASELIESALNIIELQLTLIHSNKKDIKEDIFELSKEIINSRPSMAPLINTIGFLVHDTLIITKELIRERIDVYKKDKIERFMMHEKNFRNFFRAWGKDKYSIMLISFSSTINNLLLKNTDLNLEFYILESRPLLEGRRVAEILSDYFKVNLIVDAASGKFLDQVDLVLIGVDSILEDGSVVNKIGTYPLAVIAKTKKIHVFAVGDSFKYNLRSHYGQNVLIEKKSSKEIYDRAPKRNFEIHNYYFDITPSEYIDGIISDLGILSIQAFIERIKDYLPIKWFKYFINDEGF
ncbi:MAG: translation initiation factor eIF-2B [Promethearchaeota archaeon]